MDIVEYQMKYRRFVQGIITEAEFRQYLTLSLSKKDLINLILVSAKSLRKAVAIGEPLEIKG